MQYDHDDPIPVRIVQRGEYEGPEGEVRLAFDTWVVKVLVVLYVVGCLTS